MLCRSNQTAIEDLKCSEVSRLASVLLSGCESGDLGFAPISWCTCECDIYFNRGVYSDTLGSSVISVTTLWFTTISELLISLKADTAALLSAMERYFSDWCDDLRVVRTETDYGTFSTSQVHRSW
jgi:hypothetical protein